jgi:outer membrane protein assembly factor BamB
MRRRDYLKSERRMALKVLTSSLLGAFVALPGMACAANVLTYHNGNQRHGAYIEPTLTQSAASGTHLDTGFSASVSGNVYAQPLFWHPAGAAHGQVIVATENNQVSALDSVTGATLWAVQLPASVPSSALPCGNINPEGITGTPVIDPKTGTLYLDLLTEISSAPKHEIYALSLANKGQTLSGWPINVDSVMKAAGSSFSSYTQGERSAALLFGGNVYFTYAGRSGDCGTYHGTVIQIDPSTKTLGGYWQTRANGGGIWAQGGISSDSKSLFVTTGNTMGAQTWQDGEAILRLKPGLAHSTNLADYFAPSNWQTLDNEDADLGGTEAIPLAIDPGSGKAAQRVIAFGKDGNAYLTNLNRLGGIGGQIAITAVSNSEIITAPAVYATKTSTMVAFTNAAGKSCSGNDMTMLNVAASGTSPITTAWCAAFNGHGSPIITTTDGTSNPVLWVAGAEGDNLLHGYNATTGAVLFAGGGSVMSGLHHFQTLIAAEGRLYVAADNKVYAFSY